MHEAIFFQMLFMVFPICFKHFQATSTEEASLVEVANSRVGISQRNHLSMKYVPNLQTVKLGQQVPSTCNKATSGLKSTELAQLESKKCVRPGSRLSFFSAKAFLPDHSVCQICLRMRMPVNACECRMPCDSGDEDLCRKT